MKNDINECLKKLNQTDINNFMLHSLKTINTYK